MKILVLLQLLLLPFFHGFSGCQAAPQSVFAAEFGSGGSCGVVSEYCSTRTLQPRYSDHRMPGESHNSISPVSTELPGASFNLVWFPAVSGTPRRWPIDSQITRGFEPPVENWLAGHRGIDLAATSGESVRAPEDGVVSWIGTIDGVPMLNLSHTGGIRTTYQPVHTSLTLGTRVAGGDEIGWVAENVDEIEYDHEGMHFGVKRGDHYLDPEVWLAAKRLSTIRLFGGSDGLLQTAG